MIRVIRSDWLSVKRNFERLCYCCRYLRLLGVRQFYRHLYFNVFPLRKVTPLKMLLKGVYDINSNRWTLKRSRLVHLLNESGKIRIVVSFTGLGGAADYLLNHLRTETVGSLTFVVMDAGMGGIKDYVQVEVWRDGKSMFHFIAHTLSFFGGFPRSKEYDIVINELVGWHTYVGEEAMSDDGIGRIIDEILLVKTSLNAKVRFLLHDHYCMCPRIALVDSDDKYCNSEYCQESCVRCVKRGGAKYGEFSPDTDIIKWRFAFQKLFQACDEIRAFSNDTLNRVKRIYPVGDVYKLVPHGDLGYLPRVNVKQSECITIGVFGAIGVIKGRKEVLALSQYLSQNNISANIVVVGNLADCPEDLLNITVTGQYKRADLPKIVERRKINVAFVSSICPETFSFVTQELIMLGLPVVCFNIGAQAERVSKYNRGRISMSTDPRDIWRAIESAHAALRSKPE